MKDVVVIGGGHNGLVAAAVLAQAGREVLLLEAREQLGGRCAPIPFHPGFTAPGLLDDTSGFRPRIVRELGLEQDGLRRRAESRAVLVTDGRRRLLLPPLGAEEISAVDEHPADVGAYRDWMRRCRLFQPVIRSLLDEPPPPLTPRAGRDLWRLGKQGLALRRLGGPEMLELLRVVPMSVADWLSEYFESPLLTEGLAYLAVMGGRFGPRAAGTAANLLHSVCCAHDPIVGGPAALIHALTANCIRSGVEIRNGAEAARIGVSGGRVREVELSSGEVIPAAAVLAACHPRTALLKLLSPTDLTVQLESQARAMRARGTAARVHVALGAPLSLDDDGESPAGVRWGGGGPSALEQTFDAAKYGEVSLELHFDFSFPPRAGAGRAAEGGEVLAGWVHAVPYHTHPDWNAQARARASQVVLERLTRLDPEAERKIEAIQVLTPYDLEVGFGLAGGQIFHLERTLDQSLMLRPSASLSRYATPISGLWLGSAGCHPGGEISGLPGYLAAKSLSD